MAGAGSGPRVLQGDDPTAIDLTFAIRGGDLVALRTLLDRQPDLASVRILGRKGHRTPLLVAADWPGYFPAAPTSVAILIAAGADPNDDTGTDRPETPLHWAASSDDADVAAALIDGGAKLDTPGGSIGTPLDNAVGYGCWHVARLLVSSGAPVDKPWQAAALGMLDRLDELLGEQPSREALSQAFWHACSGAERRAAEHLLDRGAELDWVPAYTDGTPLDAASAKGTRRDNVISWLRERGARSSKETGVSGTR